MKRILVPTDFSDHSRTALKFAIDLAKEAQAEIFVVHMVQVPVLPETTFGIQPHPFDPKLMKELENKATAAFQKMAKNLPPGVGIAFQTIHDYVVPGIRLFVEKNKIDLMVMSTHGASGLNEFLIGSTAEKIARFSPVPLISIPNETTFNSIRNIVFPSNLQFDQKERIDDLKEFQQLCKAKLHVLLVNTPLNFYSDDQAHFQLETFAKYYNLQDYTLNFRSHKFERAGILDFMNEIKGDMIAMATHGRTGLAHFFKGSIAESVLNRMDHPIWTWKLRN